MSFETSEGESEAYGVLASGFSDTRSVVCQVIIAPAQAHGPWQHCSFLLKALPSRSWPAFYNQGTAISKLASLLQLEQCLSLLSQTRAFEACAYVARPLVT